MTFGRLLIDYNHKAILKNHLSQLGKTSQHIAETCKLWTFHDLPLLELIFLEHTPISRLIEDFLRLFAAKVCLFKNRQWVFGNLGLQNSVLSWSSPFIDSCYTTEISFKLKLRRRKRTFLSKINSFKLRTSKVLANLRLRQRYHFDSVSPNLKPTTPTSVPHRTLPPPLLSWRAAQQVS